MKKILIGLLFVVCTIFSASANTVTFDLSCGKSVNTDSSCLVGKGAVEEFLAVMESVHCKN